MGQVILRKTKDATVSMSDAVAVVASAGKVLSQSGNNLLVEIRPAKLRGLSKSLAGWIISPQSSTVPVPDARPKLKVKAALKTAVRRSRKPTLTV